LNGESNASLHNAANLTGTYAALNGSAITSLTPGNITAGTAGISISGNAATATSATTATTAGNVSGTVAIAHGGTGQTTQVTALNALLPTQTALLAGDFLTTDGTGNVTWAAAGASTTAAHLTGSNLTGDVSNVADNLTVHSYGAGTTFGTMAHQDASSVAITGGTGTFATMTAATADATLGGSGTMDGKTAGNTQAGFAGRVQFATVGSTPTLTATIFNTNVTTSSVIILTCERDANSNSSGVEYIANLAYNSVTPGRAITAGTSFKIEIKRADGSSIPGTNGCTINYMIIN
jgi:hypothetical protein